MNNNKKQHTVHKEMGLTHEDLLRLIPVLAGDDKFEIRTHQIIITQGADRNVRLDYSEQRIRKIAMFTLPVTDIDFVFTGYDQQQVKDFIFRFDRIFQRGGG